MEQMWMKQERMVLSDIAVEFAVAGAAGVGNAGSVDVGAHAVVLVDHPVREDATMVHDRGP